MDDCYLCLELVRLEKEILERHWRAQLQSKGSLVLNGRIQQCFESSRQGWGNSVTEKEYTGEEW